MLSCGKSSGVTGHVNVWWFTQKHAQSCGSGTPECDAALELELKPSLSVISKMPVIVFLRHLLLRSLEQLTNTCTSIQLNTLTSLLCLNGFAFPWVSSEHQQMSIHCLIIASQIWLKHKTAVTFTAGSTLCSSHLLSQDQVSSSTLFYCLFEYF